MRTIDILPTSFKEVKDIFDLLNNFDAKIILQPNRCHFILNALSKTYNCTFIHIIRNPIDTWISQILEPAIASGSNKAKLVCFIYRKNIINKNINLGRIVLANFIPKIRKIGDTFSIHPDYEIIREKFNLNLDPKDWLDKMLVVWTYCNYHAFKQAEECDKGMVVYYEQVTKEPEKWFKIMSDFSGVNFDLKYAKILKPRITKDEKLRKRFVERLERLGLIDMVNEFYPPERWFG